MPSYQDYWATDETLWYDVITKIFMTYKVGEFVNIFYAKKN